MRELAGPFSRFACRRLLPTEEALIARLELQRIKKGAVRAYVIDPNRHYERLLILYSAYIQATFGGGEPVAVLGPTKKNVRLPLGLSPKCVRLFSGRKPDHIRGFGAFRAAVMVRADRLTEHSNRDRTGRRAMQAFNSAVPECRDSSLIFIGESYSRWSRLFSIMYRRICGVPFRSDAAASRMPPMDAYLAIDVRLLTLPETDDLPLAEVEVNPYTVEALRNAPATADVFGYHPPIREPAPSPCPGG